MPFRLLLILIAYTFIYSPAISQEPDFKMDELLVIKGPKPVMHQEDISCRVEVFSNGKHLSFVIEVRDNHVETNPGNFHTDHVELRFALPPPAYPKEFEYNLHPHYVYAAPEQTRGNMLEEPKGRFFSTYSEYASKISLQDFIKQHDYPDHKSIRKDSLWVPTPKQLRAARVDYGMVRFGLFPDKRPPLLYNKEYYQPLQEALNLTPGLLESGIVYTVDIADWGYIINAQISPEALGFVILPEMKEIWFAVDVIDTDFKFRRGITILSTSEVVDTDTTSRVYSKAELKKPFQTNFSQVPDRVYNKTGFHPTSMYTEKGWVFTAVDVDVLSYKEQVLSKSLTEVKFSQMPVTYTQELDKPHLVSLEKLTIDHDFINQIDKQCTFYILNQHLLQANHVTESLAVLDTLENKELFYFPDETPGIILTQNNTLDPNGWGPHGEAREESIEIYRIERNGVVPVLKVEQSTSPPGYCQIGDWPYEGYRVTRLNWVEEGTMLVLKLENHKVENTKRIRISWDEKGQNLEMKELP